jgi:hypothetical protein
MENLPPQLIGQSPTQGMQGMGGPMMEGYDQMSETSNEPEKILAYFSLDELQDLDQVLLQLLQGIYNKQLPEDILFDPVSNLRDYTPLDTILKNPKIEEAFSSAFSQGHQKFAMGGEVNEPGRPTDPELEKIRLEGRKGDTELAIITPFLLETFSKWAGREPGENPNGIPEFAFFSNLFKGFVRIAAPIAGAIFGGPLGAALAGGLATKLTGGSWGQSLGAGALGGFGAMAAPILGGSFQSAFPGVAGSLGSATRGIFGQNIGNALGNLFTPGVGGGVVSGLGGAGLGNVGLSGVGQMILGRAQEAGQGAAQAGIQAPGQTGGSGLLGRLLGGSALPLIGSGLLMAKGHGEEKKSLRDYERALREGESRQRQEAESNRERLGFNAPLSPARPFQYRPTNIPIPQEQYERGIVPNYFNYNLAEQNAAGGGAIRGDGKGQQDNIPKKIKENSYIIDASTVSDIGDGSSEAGIKDLDRYFGKIPSRGMQQKAKGGYIDALVSNQEYEVSPERVTAIGGGSNEKGAKILKKFVKEVRARKRTSGQKLPPKAKPISGYLKNIR